MDQNNFEFGLQPKRPFWKDLAMFCLTVSLVWSGTHLVLNYGAFAQMAEYKVETLKTSLFEVLEDTEPNPENTEVLELEKIRKPRQELFKNKALKPKDQAKNMFATIEVMPPDNRISIPRIGKNVPLVTVPTHKYWKQLEKNIQDGLRGGVVVHPISRKPGIPGNFFVTGHSSYYAWDKGRFKDVFALLHEVEIGDIVEIFWEGKKYTYEMNLKNVVPPTETSVLNQPKDKTILTLMTCTPVGTNKNRLVLSGKLMSVE
jgi:LPXTG-site transpeptidase (sortase) family protein